MKILIGGGCGYIGSRLIPELVALGHEVDVIDLLWFGNHLPEGVTVLEKDLFDISSKDMAGYEQFIFLAGLSNDPMAEYSPAKNFVYNGALPSYLAYEAKKAGIKRFIYASSGSVYGYSTDGPYDEEAPITCSYPYGISKFQGEKGVMQLQDADFSVIALRQGTLSGYSPRMRFDLIVNTMFKAAMTTGQITVNNPAIWRPIFDIRDAVTAYAKAIDADYSVSGTFNVASENYTVGQVAEAVKAEVEKLTGKAITIETKHVEDFRNYRVSIEKAETILGFRPQYGLTDTIQDVFKNLEAYGDFSNESFYNIAVFKHIDTHELS
jgi:nucleoside-diphosphate-sugar epimerase